MKFKIYLFSHVSHISSALLACMASGCPSVCIVKHYSRVVSEPRCFRHCWYCMSVVCLEPRLQSRLGVTWLSGTETPWIGCLLDFESILWSLCTNYVATPKFSCVTPNLVNTAHRLRGCHSHHTT